MLAIIDKFNDDEVTPMMLDDDAWFVTHAFNGNDELQFTFTEESGYYDLLEEESKVLAIGLRGRSNRFVVKNIDSHDGVVTVNCDIDLYDWQQTIFDTYGGGSARTLEKVLQDVTPSGWSYSGQEQFGKSEIFQTGSREPVKAGTPLDVLDLACEVYGCVFNFDNIAKHLYAIDPESYTPSGDFLSDEVNLKSVGYVGNSEGYATRLYPYGKRDDDGENPVTIESVNGGLPYVTNNQFSDDIICVGWSDERYTDPEHLKEAAILRLAELAVPTRSYECDVSQLNRNVWLYMVLTMIDRKHRTRVDQQVVEWREYGRHDLDVVTLSATPPTFESIVSDGLTQDDVQDAINSNNGWIQGIIHDAIDNATDAITGNDGGYFRWIFDSEGRPIELVNLGDSMDINDAKQVWRWNAAGLGHSSNGYNGPYTMAMLADGSINASMITTGILNAGVIKAGVISDVLGRNFWNMETGEFSLSASTTIDGEPIVVSVDTQFAVNDSSITPPTSGWTTSLPTYDPGTQFLWSRTVTVYADGNVAYSGTICLTAQSSSGQDGLSVTGFVEQYYLSTSNETQVGGSWSTEQPEWQPGLFIWMRLYLTWSNETVTYTDPSLANALNSANQNAHDAEQAVSTLDESLNQKGVFDRLTNNGQTQGIYLENGRIYINATYIATGTMNADLIRTGRIEAKNGDFWFDLDSGEMYISTLDVEIQNEIDMRVPQIVQQKIEDADIPGEVKEQMYTLIRLTSAGVEVGATANDIKSVVGPGMFKLTNGSNDYMRMYPTGTPDSGHVYFMMPYGTGFEFQTSNAARFLGSTGGYSFSSEVSHINAHTSNSIETWSFSPNSQTGSFNYDLTYPDSLFLNDIDYLVIYYYAEYVSSYGKAGSIKIKISRGETREVLLTDTVLTNEDPPQQITSAETMLIDLSSSIHDIIVTRYGPRRAAVNRINTIRMNTNPGTIFRIYRVSICK